MQESIAAVAANIEKLLADAAAEQKAYEDEVAKAAANDAQYEADLAIIERVQNNFDTVLEKIAGFDKAVAEAVAEDVESIRASIVTLRAAAEQSHDDGTSVEDADLLQAMANNVEALIAELDKKAELEQQKITTNIGKVIHVNNDNVMYDLSGRQVKHANGLVIIGKKKYVVK